MKILIICLNLGRKIIYIFRWSSKDNRNILNILVVKQSSTISQWKLYFYKPPFLLINPLTADDQYIGHFIGQNHEKRS